MSDWVGFDPCEITVVKVAPKLEMVSYDVDFRVALSSIADDQWFATSELPCVLGLLKFKESFMIWFSAVDEFDEQNDCHGKHD